MSEETCTFYKPSYSNGPAMILNRRHISGIGPKLMQLHELGPMPFDHEHGSLTMICKHTITRKGLGINIFLAMTLRSETRASELLPVIL
jgi:hypothetical protein